MPHRNTRLPLIERFYMKIRRSPTCWLWTGGRSSNGYGTFTIPRSATRAAHNVSAHRFAYEHFRGPIPAGLSIDHLCRNRACINPAHLEVVPIRTNILRGQALGAINARKAHCSRGHPFNDTNTRRRKDGARTCRLCERITRRERERARRKLGWRRCGEGRKWTLAA